MNVMWAVHAVHHQSEDYNFAVALRQPVLEPLTWMPFFAVLAILGVPPEVILLAFSIDLFYQFWLHTELVRRLPRPIEWLLNTPHRVRDKLRTIVAHPAWLPPGVEHSAVSGEHPHGSRRAKYRPRPPRSVLVHAVALFAIASLCLGPLVLFDAYLPLSHLAAAAVCIAALHVVVAAWIEARPWAALADSVATAAFTGAALWILGTQVSWPVGAAAATVAAGIALATRPRTRAGATGSVAPPVAPDTLPP